VILKSWIPKDSLGGGFSGNDKLARERIARSS
jgi:hypothetical protein